MSSFLARLRNYLQGSLARALLSRLGLALLLSISALSWGLYRYSSQQLQAKSLDELRLTVSAQAREGSEWFAAAEANTLRLREEYLHRLTLPKPAGWERDYAHWFSLYPDGLTRVNPALDNHKRLPNAYLRPGLKMDEDLRWRTWVSFQLLREWGPPMTQRYYSAYFDLPGEGLIMYSPAVNWGAEATPETNNFDYPPVAGAAPDRNPSRVPSWTPVYFDDKAGIYMVSIVTPIDLQGRWLACVSQDVAIDTLIQHTLDDKLPGTFSLIYSRDGKLVVHPRFTEKISAAKGDLDLRALQDPLLDELAGLEVLRDGQVQVARSRDGAYMLGMANIDGPDWIYVTAYPTALIQARAFDTVRIIPLVGAAMLVVVLLLLRWILARQISRPIAALQRATRSIASGDFSPRLRDGRRDEIGQLAKSFLSMGEELRRREASVQQLTEQLESRVQARTAELSKANRELTQAMQHLQDTQQELMRSERLAALGRLVAGVAHELGTPMGNAMLTASTLDGECKRLEAALSEGLRRSTLTVFIEQVREGSRLLQSNLERANELLRGFKQVAVDQAGAQRRRFDLAELVQEILATLAPGLKRLPYEIETEIAPGIEFDSYPGALGQVLTNLINNAVLHGFEGRAQGRVRLSATLDGPQHVVLSVSDDGVGMAPEVAARVFDPFFTTKMGQGGTGLGLNISHNLVSHVLCGSIRVESEPGQGSRFLMRLPRTAPQGGVDPADAQAGA